MNSPKPWNPSWGQGRWPGFMPSSPLPLGGATIWQCYAARRGSSSEHVRPSWLHCEILVSSVCGTRDRTSTTRNVPRTPTLETWRHYVPTPNTLRSCWPTTVARCRWPAGWNRGGSPSSRPITRRNVGCAHPCGYPAIPMSPWPVTPWRPRYASPTLPCRPFVLGSLRDRSWFRLLAPETWCVRPVTAAVHPSSVPRAAGRCTRVAPPTAPSSPASGAGRSRRTGRAPPVAPRRSDPVWWVPAPLPNNWDRPSPTRRSSTPRPITSPRRLGRSPSSWCAPQEQSHARSPGMPLPWCWTPPRPWNGPGSPASSRPWIGGSTSSPWCRAPRRGDGWCWWARRGTVPCRRSFAMTRWAGPDESLPTVWRRVFPQRRAPPSSVARTRPCGPPSSSCAPHPAMRRPSPEHRHMSTCWGRYRSRTDTVTTSPVSRRSCAPRPVRQPLWPPSLPTYVPSTP